MSTVSAEQNRIANLDIPLERDVFLRTLVRELAGTLENFGKMEPTMNVKDGRRWELNQERLVLGRDVDKEKG